MIEVLLSKTMMVGLGWGMMGALTTVMNTMSVSGLEKRTMDALATALRRTHITNNSFEPLF